MTVIVKESGFDKNLEVHLKDLNRKVGKVGWFKKLKYPNGEVVAQVAAKQEYGYTPGRIPARPYFRPTIQEKKNSWKSISYVNSKAVLRGQFSATEGLKLLVYKASEDVKETISKIYTPPLSPYTIEKRLSKYRNNKFVGNLYKPLIDTGYMFASLSYAVESQT